MSAADDNPTPFPEVNLLLKELLESIQAILGNHFIGMYLDGSLTSKVLTCLNAHFDAMTQPRRRIQILSEVAASGSKWFNPTNHGAFTAWSKGPRRSVLHRSHTLPHSVYT
jgi:hypothetical protein